MSTVRRSPTGAYEEYDSDGNLIKRTDATSGKSVANTTKDFANQIREEERFRSKKEQRQDYQAAPVSDNDEIPLHEWIESVFDLGCAEGRWADSEGPGVRKDIVDRLLVANFAIGAALQEVQRKNQLKTLTISKKGNVYGHTGYLVEATLSLLEVLAALNVPVGDQLQRVFEARASKLENQ
jgi:hypothetical protein